MMEIKQALADKKLIVVRNGDDLHIRENVDFDCMIRCCLDDSKCYPQINELLIEARGGEHTYLGDVELKNLIGEEDFAKLNGGAEMKEIEDGSGPAKRSPGI